MALPHKEWSAYLDKILDSYIRTNVTIDAVDYMIDRMEEIFSEYLVTVPEYSSNSVYPLNLDPLQTFLARPNVRSSIPIVPSGSTGLEEKWVVKREIMGYIKGVVELSSLKMLKNGPRSRTLPTAKCWLSDERAFQPMYMEPALLTRKAKAETPLQTNEFQEDLTPGRKYGRTKSSRLLPPNSTEKRLPSHKRETCFTSILETGLSTVPVHQETMSQEESEKLLMPKLSIPRTALEGVWSCIRATPFSSGLKNTMPIFGHLRSERVMMTVEGGDTDAATSLGGRISPPLFPRDADAQQRALHSTYAATSAIEVLKDVLKPTFMHADMETQEEDIMANMRIAEGWRECQSKTRYTHLMFPRLPTVSATNPLDLGPSSTPPMIADRSQRNVEEDDDDDESVLQIDELMIPSSPPFGNRELKELFRTRMDQILLPRKEYPLCRLGGGQSTMADRDYPNPTLSTTLKETLNLPSASASQTGAKAQEGFTIREAHETMDLGPEVVEVLDELCRDVKGLDKYSTITKDTLEDKDGMFLPVPSLPPPSQGFVIATLPDILHLGKPFEVLPLNDALMTLDIVPRPSASVILVEPAKGLTGLKLELSWRPFVYPGPVISHETVCEVHLSPFHTLQDHRHNLEWERNVTTAQKVNQLLEVVGDTREVEERDRFGPALWEGNDYNHAHASSKCGLEDGWSGAGVLLLTRTETQRAKGVSATRHAPRNHGEPPGMNKSDLDEDPHRLAKAESQYGAGESPAVELSSEGPENMILDENPLPPDDRPQYQHQRDVNQSPYFQGEIGPFLYSQHAASAVDTDGHGILESGSSYGYKSALGISRAPIGNHFSYFQTGREEIAPLLDNDMGLEAPPAEFNFSPSIANDIENSPSPPEFQRSPHHPTFSNVNLLQDFLAHRTTTGYQYTSHHTEGTPSLEATAQVIEDSFETRKESPPAKSKWHTLPLELLSKTIVLPEQWSVPSARHRYLASLPFLQRRALVQKLKLDCSVDLSEAHKAIEADLIVDTHTTVKFITVSDLVPSNFEALMSSIIGLGYGFTRILIVLEAYPFSWSTLSAQKLESSHREGLKLITQTVISTFTRLRRTVIIGMGMLEGPNDQGVAEDLGHVELEFALSWSPDDTVRLVRCMGDYAESVVGDWEKEQLWGPRLWLEASDMLTHCEHRGMNTFAALAIISITPFTDFIELPLLDKVNAFGRLIGDKRMKLFHQKAKENLT